MNVNSWDRHCDIVMMSQTHDASTRQHDTTTPRTRKKDSRSHTTDELMQMVARFGFGKPCSSLKSFFLSTVFFRWYYHNLVWNNTTATTTATTTMTITSDLQSLTATSSAPNGPTSASTRETNQDSSHESSLGFCISTVHICNCWWRGRLTLAFF